ncbi:hypothetical protein E3N88_09787 [Mikania micrantha]|uniref:Endonuclease/exonuclease/phosphatase domain-containing protein n=1 Tax=Mikania micrantha TaxID=192012 RepID=A0A5N6PM26_9ASTR|nr:hypothetical protein E3N88_09787 [Mikania micrantha]
MANQGFGGSVLQSVAPDLNFPPPVFSPKQNRRMRSGVVNNFSGGTLGGVDSQSPDGVFCFGNAIPNPSMLNETLPGGHLEDPIQAEINETIAVGGWVARTKVDWIKSLKLRFKIHFLAIQETHLVDTAKVPLHKIWGNYFLDFDYVNARGRSGGVLSVWNPKIFSKLGVEKGDNFLLVYGTMVGCDEQINIVNVYAPQDAVGKRALWESLGGLMDAFPGMWIFMGDFNVVRFREERMNSEFDHRGARDFNDFIFRSGLHEYNMGGMKFTFMTPDGKKFSKIDRMLVCSTFLHRWSGAKLMAHSRLWSDHSPLSLSTKVSDYGPSPFKFFSSWLNMNGIDEIVSNAVVDYDRNGRPDIVFMNILRNVKHKIKAWRLVEKEKESAMQVALEDECFHLETLAELGFINELEHMRWSRCKNDLKLLEHGMWPTEVAHMDLTGDVELIRCCNDATAITERSQRGNVFYESRV